MELFDKGIEFLTSVSAEFLKSRGLSKAGAGLFSYLSILKSEEIEITYIHDNDAIAISKVHGLFGSEIKKKQKFRMRLDQNLTSCLIYFHPDYFKKGRKLTNKEEKIEFLKEEYGSDEDEISYHIDDDLYVNDGIFRLDQEGVRKFSINVRDLL